MTLNSPQDQSVTSRARTQMGLQPQPQPLSTWQREGQEPALAQPALPASSPTTPPGTPTGSYL